MTQAAEKRVSRERKLICLAILLLTLIAFLGWGVHSVWGFGSSGAPRVVVRVVAPDGTEFCVVQEANHNLAEPFTTSVVYRKPGSRWGWFYYDHEDFYWSHGQAAIDLTAKRITVYRSGERTLTFDWETEIYTKWDGQRASRTFTNAQTWLPSGWTVTNLIARLP